MRIVPVITALLVVVFLFLIVIERDALFDYLGTTQSAEATGDARRWKTGFPTHST